MSAPLRDGRVRPMWSLSRHYWLAKRMAKATGVDLAAAMDVAALTQSDWADMVRRCRGCAWREGCERWLDTCEKGERPVPGGCENREKFQRLKTVLEEQRQ